MATDLPENAGRLTAGSAPLRPLMAEDRTAELVGRAEELLGRVEALPDPAARDTAVELVAALLALYGEGLARITAVALEAGGPQVADELATDDLVSHLLSLHDLHPVDLPTRLRRAIDAVRPQLGGVEPELIDVAGDVVRLRLPAASGCRSSAATRANVLQEAILAGLPEVERVEVEQAPPPPAVIPLASLWQGDALAGVTSSAGGG